MPTPQRGHRRDANASGEAIGAATGRRQASGAQREGLGALAAEARRRGSHRALHERELAMALTEQLLRPRASNARALRDERRRVFTKVSRAGEWALGTKAPPSCQPTAARTTAPLGGNRG